MNTAIKSDLDVELGLDLGLELRLELNSTPENQFDDTKYFEVLGQVLVDCAIQLANSTHNFPYIKDIKQKVIACLKKLSIDEIVDWLSPQTDTKYSILAEYICQSINKPNADIYLRLLGAGFELDSLGSFAVKLITNKPEFLANEAQIFSKYLTAEKSKKSKKSIYAVEIKNKILENPEFSYEFIMSYLQLKYPKVFIGIQWNKLAIAKGAIEIIHKYDLKLTDADISRINQKFCTIQNINLYKSFSPYKLVKTNPSSDYELFKDISIDDFVTVNKITDTDHKKINYIKYLGNFNIGKVSSRTYNCGGYIKELPNNIHKYHPDLLRQFLDYIHIDGDLLALCKITLEDKLEYIKQKIQTKEYTPQHIARFINNICYLKSVYLDEEYLEQSKKQSIKNCIPSTLNNKPTLVGSNSSETPGPSHSKAHPPGGWAYNRVSTVDTNTYSFTEIEQKLKDAGIGIPWPELLELRNSNIEGEIKWSQIRDIYNPIHHKSKIGIYIRFLIAECKNPNNWTPSIQLEYWNILIAIEKWLLPHDRDALIKVLPIEIIRDVPIEMIWKYRLYRHDSFHKIINVPLTLNSKPTPGVTSRTGGACPTLSVPRDWPTNNSPVSTVLDDNSKSFKIRFAKILKHELERLFSANRDTANNYELIELLKKELGFVITRFYAEGLDILEYLSVPGIAEVVFESGTEYRNLSFDTLLGLITLTSSNTIIHAFHLEIERKLKEQAETDKWNEFTLLFDCLGESHALGQDGLSLAIARLASVVRERPIRYWSEDDYKYACEKGFLSADILIEFRKTQPAPHPDWNWRTLTIFLGTDQTILAYQELPWQTPVYFSQDSDWSVRNITWEYLQKHTQLFSADNEIWTKFSTKLPIDFILERPNYKFQWHSIITRPDFNPTPDQWIIIKPQIKPKDLQSHPNKYPNKYNIELIMDNLDLGWNLQNLVKKRVIPLKYLHKLFNPKWFNKSILYASYSFVNLQMVDTALNNLKRKLILSALVEELDYLKFICRTTNYLFGNQLHIEKTVLGFATRVVVPQPP